MRALFLIVMFILLQSLSAQQKDIFDIARKGTIVEAKAILQKDPNAFNTKNSDGFSPLILACYRGNNEVAKFLIENGVDINAISNMGTALMAAVVKGNKPIVSLLLGKKANINLTDPNGTTALMYAVKFQNVELTRLLLERGADKTLLDKEGKSAFEYAVFSNNQEIIQLLK